MRIQLSDHFNYKRLLKFVLPSIIMMVCTSLYSIVDGFFVSNFAGKIPFAAVNLVMPLLMAMGSLGFMIGTGGSAVIAKTLGEGKRELANEYFTMLIYFSVVLGIIVSVLGFLFIRPITVALGASGELIDYAVIYGRILICSIPAFILQNIFQNFFIVAERPELSLRIAIIAGLTNVVFDFIFIAVFKWGIVGAAVATLMGEMAGGIMPIFYFARKNNSLLRITKTKFHGKMLVKACANGSSELMTSVSSSVVNILYNYQLIRIAGEDGIAAYGVIMYANFVFTAIFLGYSIGSAPIISYHYGAANTNELKNLFKKSLVLIGAAGVGLTLAAELFAAPLIKIFVGYDADLFKMTCRGFQIYALFFLITGFNIWGSSFFTALNNGIISAAISFLRTLVFQVGIVLILPIFLGLDGIWFSVVAAELLALGITFLFFFIKRKQYHYA